MAKDLPREKEQRGTGKVFMWGAVIIAVLFVALMAVFILGPFLVLSRHLGIAKLQPPTPRRPGG
ncbi:hypothetical protein [Mesorhizobium sp. M1322]|uniref:hypothetical protein n=1 Tax=Mesorhizobium sp. M1322 TaxID=2957081 RepID=UPI00333700DC